MEIGIFFSPSGDRDECSDQMSQERKENGKAPHEIEPGGGVPLERRGRE